MLAQTIKTAVLVKAPVRAQARNANVAMAGTQSYQVDVRRFCGTFLML